MSNDPNARPVHGGAGATRTDGAPDKKDIVAEKGKDEAQQLKEQTAGSGERMADTAKDKAADVKNEASHQAQDLLGQLKDDAQGYVGPQQERAASTVRSISDEISALSRGEQPQSNYVAGLLGSVSGQVDSLASSLENKDAQELLGDVRRFAARRPGTFLAIAAGIGFVAGRVTRGAKDSDDVATDREGVKEYFGAADQHDRTGGPASGSQAGQTSESAFTTPGQPEPTRTYTDRVPGTVYPDQEGDRR
ncbi:ATP synthase F0 subunit B [Kocuria coralli]|uniref:ATP synthase F0 subunit B n=1 Tax=Kocuria coralli TaxID=1461025 RepID=A0A5J5KYX0_9MICC|nr:ATP synthase F0 subunit B [Kocuria coralli]KAA9394829.1 ATP synthase F0 subunit B [Kocuria coralli]